MENVLNHCTHFLRLLITSQMKVIQNLSHYTPSCNLYSVWIQFRNLHSLFLTRSLFCIDRTRSFLEKLKDDLLHQPAPHKRKVTRNEVQEIFIVIQFCHHPLGTIRQVTSCFRVWILSLVTQRQESSNWFLRSLWKPCPFPSFHITVTLPHFSTNNTEPRKEF